MAIPQEQVPGIYRRRIGHVIVTALNDGSITIPAGALVGIDEAGRDAIYHAAGRRAPFASAINGFLLQWPDRTVLIDTGAGPFMGPLLGRLRGNLRAAGVAAEAVDMVLLTHMHIDHVGGLADDQGAASFPRAVLMAHEAELAFWLDVANRGNAPSLLQDTFDIAARSIAPYRERLTPFRGSNAILPGLEPVPLPGHTSGHTGFLLTDGDERLLIWADTCHAPEVQCARPDVTVAFDADPAQAARSRRGVLERAVAEDLLITGMHMSFPGFNRIVRVGSGYALQPQIWRYDL